MDAELPPTAAVQAIRDFAAEQLRQEHPLLKSEALERMLNTVSQSLEDDLAKEAPAIARSKARVYFFSLPPEVRNEIYELVLQVKYEVIKVAVFGHGKIQQSNTDLWWTRQRLLNGRALELVSRQARLEARSLFYGLNTFKIEIHGLANLALHRHALASFFKKVIAPKAKLFKTLVLRLKEYQIQTRLANYVWRRHFSEGEIVPYTLYHGPAPLVTQEMVLSMFPFNEIGVPNKYVGVELRESGDGEWKRMTTEEEARAVLGTA